MTFFSEIDELLDTEHKDSPAYSFESNKSQGRHPTQSCVTAQLLASLLEGMFSLPTYSLFFLIKILLKHHKCGTPPLINLNNLI